MVFSSPLLCHVGDYTDDDEAGYAGGSGGRPELPYHNNALEKFEPIKKGIMQYLAGIWLPSKGMATNLPNASWIFFAHGQGDKLGRAPH